MSLDAVPDLAHPDQVLVTKPALIGLAQHLLGVRAWASAALSCMQGAGMVGGEP